MSRILTRAHHFGSDLFSACKTSTESIIIVSSNETFAFGNYAPHLTNQRVLYDHRHPLELARTAGGGGSW
jgi:hypothetical protein